MDANAWFMLGFIILLVIVLCCAAGSGSLGVGGPMRGDVPQTPEVEVFKTRDVKDVPPEDPPTHRIRDGLILIGAHELYEESKPR